MTHVWIHEPGDGTGIYLLEEYWRPGILGEFLFEHYMGYYLWKKRSHGELEMLAWPGKKSKGGTQ